MTVWKNASMTNYYDGADKVVVDCEVRIDGSRIVVSYEDEDGPSIYEGEEAGPGHYKLMLARKKGRATLHRGPGEDILEGHWIEQGYEGMWRIQLGDE